MHVAVVPANKYTKTKSYIPATYFYGDITHVFTNSYLYYNNRLRVSGADAAHS